MNKFLIIFLLISSTSIAQEQLPVQSYDDPDFEIGSTHYLFGDNVILREGPSKNSNELETLSIGTELIIKAQENETMRHKGYTCHWYKVRTAEGKTGCIMGGLIARDYAEVNDYKYVISVRRSEDERTAVEYRFIKKSGGYLSGEADLSTYSFLVKADGNRGLEGIESMLFIDYYAEACGVDGGGIYIFNDGENLIKAMKISSLVDGGSFWFSEELTFPDDKGGEEGLVIYEREHGQEMDEETQWMKTNINRLNLKWENGAFSPDVSEIDFDKID
ncbi:MAG: cytochrome c2 [Crocinitomicaceae bacterium]|jgi:cytochrome c2